MDGTKPYKFIGFGAMDSTKPYEFIGFGAMDGTKPYKFIGFGALSRSEARSRVTSSPAHFLRFSPGADHLLARGFPRLGWSVVLELNPFLIRF